MIVDLVACYRCRTKPAASICCSSHGQELCHRCYRITHFVEVCVEGCGDCAAEGLPIIQGSDRTVGSDG
jgi:hypothetical protein